jgi:rSAM/selenodomain-associated transferase 1
MKENLLIIFIRNPVLNRVKTRLAEKTGSIVALRIYSELLSATFKNASKVNSDKTIYFSDNIDNSIKPGFSFQPEVQQGSGLGERMKNAFSESFEKGYNKIVIIGSDCYDLSPEIISEAFDKLQVSDCVLGPANDGGYYLIGLRKMIPDLFSDINWGSSEVFKQTLSILKKTSAVHTELNVLSDIDTLDDVLRNSMLKKFLHD